MPQPIQSSAAGLDLSPRVLSTATVVGSPATNAEVIVASLTINRDIASILGVVLVGYVAFTMGTDGTSYNLKLHVTDIAGTTLKASGLIPTAAAVLAADSILAVHTAPALPNQVYVLTLTCTAASAASTVSATSLVALVV